MKMLKQMLNSCVLACLCAGVFCCGVSAEESAQVPSVEITVADKLTAEKLEAFGAITYEYDELGTYVTRRQMTEIIATFLRVQPEGVAGSVSPFVDVSLTDPSIDAIAAMKRSGIITGDENLCFHPDDYLTYDEAIVFIVNAAGYKNFAVREGGYPAGYHRIAIRYQMLEDLKVQSGKEHIPLCDVYKMLDSALDAPAVIAQNITGTTVDYRISETETVLSERYHITKHQGIVTGTEFTYLDAADTNLSDEQVAIDGVVYDTPGYVYGTSLGRAVYYYLRKNEGGELDAAYVEECNKQNHIFTVDSEDLLSEKTTGNRIYYEDENGKERHIKLANSTDVIYNGKCYKEYGNIQSVLPSFGHIEALDNTGDEIAEVLFVYEYHDIVVESVDLYDESIRAMFTGEEFSLDFQRNKVDIRLMPENKKIELGSLKRWDVVSVMESKSEPKMYSLYVSLETVTGTVEEIHSAFGYYVNGEYYKPVPQDLVGDEITAGVRAVFYLDMHGRIICADRGSAAGENVSYAVMTGLEYDKQSANNEIIVRLYTQNGTFLEAPLKSSVQIDGKRYETSGSGMDKVLELLSGGAKMQNGKYYVHAAYVVVYRMSDGKVSYLDTGKTGINGSLNVFASAPESSDAVTTSFLARSGNVMKVVSKKMNNETGVEELSTTYASYVPNSLYVFYVPNDGSLNDTEKYAVRRTLTTGVYHRGSNLSSSYTKYVSGFMMYNLGESKTNRVDVVMTKGNGGTSTSVTKSSTLYVTTKITSAVDPEGNPASKLYLNESASAVTAEKIRISGLISASGVPAEKLANYIKPGMVISYGTDEDGLLDKIQVLAIYDEKTGNVQVTAMDDSSNLENIQNGRSRTAGEVTYYDEGENILNLVPADGASEHVLLSGGTGNVTVYRPDTEKATTESYTVISEHDFVVIRLSGYFNIQDVIVFKR